MKFYRKIDRRCTVFILLASFISIGIGGNYKLISNCSTEPHWKNTLRQPQRTNNSVLQASIHEGEPVFIFIHTPKAGGTLIRVILEHWCIATNKSYLKVDYITLFKGHQKLERMKASIRDKIDVFFGHLPFGLHSILQLKRPVKYITMLRDPVKQAISAFHFQRFLQHYRGGAFALQAAVRQLNNTYRSRVSSFNRTARAIQLDHRRNSVISHLTKKSLDFVNAKGCFSTLGGPEGWIQVHNVSVEHLQSLNTSSLLNFANEVVRHAWKSNFTAPLSPVLMMSFEQFLTSSLNLNSTWKDRRPQWNFGNNPTTSMFCCYHLWFNHTFEKVMDEQYAKCPRIRNDRSLACALDNLKQIDLTLITEQMEISLQLLEIFLNWSIPNKLKQLLINEAVYVTPKPPPITSQQLNFAEKLVKLDRIIYQTAVLKFWTTVHSSNILTSALQESIR